MVICIICLAKNALSWKGTWGELVPWLASGPLALLPYIPPPLEGTSWPLGHSALPPVDGLRVGESLF